MEPVKKIIAMWLGAAVAVLLAGTVASPANYDWAAPVKIQRNHGWTPITVQRNYDWAAPVKIQRNHGWAAPSLDVLVVAAPLDA